MQEMQNNKIVIIDIDGVLFDPTERLERCKEEGGIINWARAFSNEEVYQDPVIKGAPEAIQQINSRFRIIYLTGRSNNCVDATTERMREEGFVKERIITRPSGDFTPDDKLKRESIEKLRFLYDYDFVAVIDDNYNGKLKPMYEALGIPCFLTFQDFFQSDIWKK